MSVLAMTVEQRAELETAQRQSRNVRHWKRYPAVLLRAAGTSVVIVAQTLGCSQASVSNWTTAWREAGVAGVREGVHPGAVRRLDAAGEQRLAELLNSAPPAGGDAATGWTVPLLQTELAAGGWRASARTIRRTLHRRGLETAALRAGPARSRRRGQKGAVAEQVGVTVEAGGAVWFGEETTVREYPPLHAAWAKRGEPANVVIAGHHGRRVLHGALNAATGACVHLCPPLSTSCVSGAARTTGWPSSRPWAKCGLRYPSCWDNAPPHHPKRVLQAAERAQITIAWLPFRAPELNPCEDLWRLMKAVVAANRPATSLDDLAQRAAAWLAALSPYDRLRCSGLLSSKFQWLST